MKVRVFIGSTSEARKYVDAIVELLGSDEIECLPWHQGVFEIGGGTQTSLVRDITDCDFAVFLLTAEDSTFSRDKYYFSPRDNVIFEAGISFGAVSPSRTFLIPARVAGLKLPSDLSGFTLTHSFDPGDEPRIGMTAPVAQIRNRIQELGKRRSKHYSGAADKLALEANRLLASAAHSIVLFGRDLSWAKNYVDTLKKCVESGVTVEVFSDKDSRTKAKANAKLLTAIGAKVFYCERDTGIKLTLIDHAKDAECRFMVSFKELNHSVSASAEKSFIYRYTVHDARDQQALWLTLIRLYDSLRGEVRRGVAGRAPRVVRKFPGK